MPRNTPPAEIRRRKELGRLVPLKALILIPLLAGVIVFALVSWADLYRNFLEANAPTITLREVPRGIGIAPVALRFDVEDTDSGLDEVVVRLRQREKTKEILRQKVNGKRSETVHLTFPGKDTGLAEGKSEVEIRAFDRSLWSNTGERVLSFEVDYKRPRASVLTTQRNVRKGGSQLLFYRASDTSLAVSGIKVGSTLFQGYPARVIDAELDQPELYAVLYTVPVSFDQSRDPIRLLAEDTVGNATSFAVPHRILDRTDRSFRVRLTDSLLDKYGKLVEENEKLLKDYMSQSGTTFPLGRPSGSLDERVTAFRVAVTTLAELQNADFVRKIPSRSFERLWEGPFYQPRGSIQAAFGNVLSYRLDTEEVAAVFQNGFTITMPAQETNVRSLNDGQVLATSALGWYGNYAIVSHGMGLTSVYAKLDYVSASQGQNIETGDSLGVAGREPTGSQYYLEFRLQGTPVDPREWWDRAWYQEHIFRKINEAKRTYGIALPTDF